MTVETGEICLASLAFPLRSQGADPPAGTNRCSVTRGYPEVTPDNHAHRPSVDFFSSPY